MTEFTEQPQEVKEVPRETQEVAEARQELDRATLEPAAAVEKSVDIKTSEAVEAAVKEAVEVVAAPAAAEDGGREMEQAAGSAAADGGRMTEDRVEAAVPTADRGQETEDRAETPPPPEESREPIEPSDVIGGVGQISSAGSGDRTQEQPATPGDLASFQEAEPDSTWEGVGEGEVSLDSFSDRVSDLEEETPTEDRQEMERYYEQERTTLEDKAEAMATSDKGDQEPDLMQAAAPSLETQTEVAPALGTEDFGEASPTGTSKFAPGQNPVGSGIPIDDGLETGGSEPPETNESGAETGVSQFQETSPDTLVKALSQFSETTTDEDLVPGGMVISDARDDMEQLKDILEPDGTDESEDFPPTDNGEANDIDDIGDSQQGTPIGGVSDGTEPDSEWIKEKIADIYKQIAALEDNLETFQQELKDLQDRLFSETEKLESLKELLAEKRSELNDLGELLAGADESEIDSLEYQRINLAQAIEKLEAEINTSNNAIYQLENQIAEKQSIISDTIDEINKLATQIGDLSKLIPPESSGSNPAGSSDPSSGSGTEPPPSTPEGLDSNE